MEFKICRVCLDRTATISVFNKHKQDDVPYCVKIMKCVNVVIVEGDGFPDAICEGCAGDLAISYDFATRCEASDKALRCLDLLQTETEPEPEIKSQGEPIKHEVKPEYDVLYTNQLEPDVYDNFLDNEPLSQYYYKNESRNDKHEVHSTINYLKNYKKSKKVLPDHMRTRKIRLKTGPIQCMICDRMLTCHSAFELHMRSHTKERPFGCDMCKKMFSNKYTLKKHIQRHYGIKDEHLKINNDSDGRRRRTKIGPLQCSTCGRMVSSRSAMDIHMRTHTGERPFACELCGAKYSMKGTLKRHMHCSHPEMHPNSKYTCEHCGKTFCAKSNIIAHMRIHTGEKPYVCPFCSQGFKQISSLIRHKRRHTGERPFTCDICGRSFLDRSLLNKHQSVHSVERKFSCHICSKTFKTKSSLKVHMDGHIKKKVWICSFCGMTFTFKGNLKTHIGRKHSEKSGMCLVCNKEFGDVEAHMRIHTGEKPYTCKICDQSYASVRSLSHHMGFKHRDATKFKCALEDCPKSFPTAAMLEFHVLKHHTQSTPYVCRHCSRGFLRPCDLSRHLKLNHQDTQTQVKSHFLKAIIKDP